MDIEPPKRSEWDDDEPTEWDLKRWEEEQRQLDRDWYNLEESAGVCKELCTWSLFIVLPFHSITFLTYCSN